MGLRAGLDALDALEYRKISTPAVQHVALVTILTKLS